MAKIDDLFGAGRGRLGNLVLYRMNGMNIVRTKPEHYSDRKSPAQLAQRQRLQVVNDFMRPFLPLIRVTFMPETEGRTARSEVQSYIMRNALAGEYPNIYVDKSRALLSRGPLPLPLGATVTVQAGGLLIEWENDAETVRRHPDDTLVVIALPAETGQSVYRFTGATRTEGSYLWKTGLQGSIPDVWIAFHNPERAEMSNSLWLG